MSLFIGIGCVAAVWALLSLIGSERVARQRVVDDAAAKAASLAKHRAEAEAVAN